ncbi:fibrobacter succinogenes major paralogous domain-containing protein [bacterium]|nr:fibrobacter succinogenes major paralogous domain-containing protein [bacterium]
MKIKAIILVLLISAAALRAQVPVISNVSFEQRTDGSLIVDIYYDLSDDDGENKKIVVEASADNGATWTLACTSLTGDVGTGIALGTGKHVVWDFFADNPNVSGDQYIIRVKALETGTMTDQDGNVYQTVKIGNQWWMAENLRVTHYRNGHPVPQVYNKTDWANVNIGACCYYDNDAGDAATYGCLYNWAAVTHVSNLAPSGWHVPSDAEWDTLTTYLGGESVAGAKLKEEGYSHWNSGNLATNESGFTALGDGYRASSGVFQFRHSVVMFWSSTVFYDHAWCRSINHNELKVWPHVYLQSFGFSVRLVKDD